MACAKGRIEPSSTTKLRLFADSGGYCQNPSCLAQLFKDIDDDTIHIAEMAHVISACDNGPRSNSSMTPEQRAQYVNLILLCPTCHTIIDKAEESYPEGLIAAWKKSHRDQIASRFGCVAYENRELAYRALAPILVENRTIFDSYGPLTEERFNPESSMPRIWRRKIRTTIIPNNRKVLSLCDANRNLLDAAELAIVERFRQHVDDFEANHVHGSNVNGIQFPSGMETLFS